MNNSKRSLKNKKKNSNSNNIFTKKYKKNIRVSGSSDLSNSIFGNKIYDEFSKNDNTKYKIKLNLILDIDETLIQSYNPYDNIYYSRKIEIDKTFFGEAVFTTYNKNIYITYLRPNLYEFLDYCYKHFNVSYWTTGKNNYCKSVLKEILTEEQYDKTKFIFSLKNDNEFTNLKTNNNFIIDKYNGRVVKDLKYLFTHSEFKKTFNSKNTLLIDDNPFNISINKHNSLFINPWCKYDKKDKKLKQIIDLLKKHSNITDIQDLKSPNIHIINNKNLSNINSHMCGSYNKYIYDKLNETL